MPRAPIFLRVFLGIVLGIGHYAASAQTIQDFDSPGTGYCPWQFINPPPLCRTSDLSTRDLGGFRP